MELSEIHDCEKCHGKIVCISIDALGVTRCAYCNQVVNYKPYYDFIKTKREEKING